MQDYGIQNKPNPDRTLEVEVDDKTYLRLPIKTEVVNIGDDLMAFIEKFAVPHIEEGDLLSISEKIVGISQRRVVHQSEVKVSGLAKLITKFVIKYPDDVGWENPAKVQVAINEVGVPRTVVAVAIGGVMKFIFKRPGWYYKIMGKDVAAIDGFNPLAVPPFNEYALLAPAEPGKVCNEIYSRFGIDAAIVDASNIAIHVLGKGDQVAFEDETISKLLAGNPAGQENEQTPLIIIRKQKE